MSGDLLQASQAKSCRSIDDDVSGQTPVQNLSRKIRRLETELDELESIKQKLEKGGFNELTIGEIQRALSAY